MKSQMNLQFNLAPNDDETATQKIEQFKNDSEKMGAVNEFVDDVLQKAQVEVERKSASTQKVNLEYNSNPTQILIGFYAIFSGTKRKNVVKVGTLYFRPSITAL